MNDKVGMLSYRMDREAFDKPYSNETAHMIDTEVRVTLMSSLVHQPCSYYTGYFTTLNTWLFSLHAFRC